jgi:hypothetical protein
MVNKKYTLQKLVAKHGISLGCSLPEDQNHTASLVSPVMLATPATPKKPARPATLARPTILRMFAGTAAPRLRKAGPPKPAPNPWIQRDTYVDVKELEHGCEAKTSLTRSTKTGRLYVVKRFSKYPVLDSNPHLKEVAQPLPNEARILLEALRPHPNIL